MRNGFKFKDRHSSEFGVTVKTKSRPVRPSVKSFTLDLPYRDGEYDFSEANPQQREHYSDRMFTVSLGVSENNLDELQRKIGMLSVWLCGSGELIFDDLPLVSWSAKILDEIIYMPEHGGKTARMDVSFRVKPFGKSLFGTEGPTLDMPIRLDSALPLEMDTKYVFSVQSEGTINVMNFGDRPISPVFKIDGLTREMSMSMGGKTLSFKSVLHPVTVDFEKQIVKDQSGNLRVSGEFFELETGWNEITITNSTPSKLTVQAVFRPEFMYCEDFRNIDWGDADDDAG